MVMKSLVAAACVAVLAFVGYFFWGQYQTGALAAEEQDFQAMRVSCLRALDIYAAANFDGKATAEQLSAVSACGENGYINAADVENAGKALLTTSK